MNTRSMLIVVALQLSCLCTLTCAAVAQWSYSGGTGPSNWQSNYPICANQKQSPINIASAQYDSSLNPITLTGYDAALSGVTIANNGHSVKVTVSGGLTMSGGLLSGTFNIAQFHFHWGSDNTKGSEHTVDGTMYPIEMHIVHYNSKYADLNAAANQSDGLAVLGVLYEVGSSDSSVLDWITQSLSSIRYSGDSTTITSSGNFRSMIPVSLSRYYTYAGSLTTPPCYESVRWSVLADRQLISSAQLAKFRELFQNAAGSANVSMVDNYRPVLSLGSRQLLMSFNSAGCFRADSLVTNLSMFTLVLGLLRKF